MDIERPVRQGWRKGLHQSAKVLSHWQGLTSAPPNSCLGMASGAVPGSSPDTLMGLAKAPLPVAAELCRARYRYQNRKVQREGAEQPQLWHQGCGSCVQCGRWRWRGTPC